MKCFSRSLIVCAMMLSVCPRNALAAVNASSNPAGPSQPTSYNISGGGGSGSFSVSENVVLDTTAGRWLTSLVNSGGSGIPSGADRTIVETMTNTGAISWTGWHESIVSRTTINQTDDSPGFLFRENSLTVQADYGSGFINLTQGVDYTIVAVPDSGPPGGGNGTNWESVDVLLSPARTILSGNTLRIQKDIFEVFLDADTWRPDEAAVIGQYPVPEPTSTIAMASLAAAVMRRRRVV